MADFGIPMVSVIMPVYNAGQYLQGAVDSVLAQTYTDFELILIDDGSTDDSGDACDRYGETDDRVRAIHQPNGGICAARNSGLREARGKYIAFCDNDDKMSPDCLQLAVNRCEATGCDVLRFRRRHFRVNEKETVTDIPKPFTEKCVVIDSWKEYMYVMSRCGFGIWTGVYRASLLQAYNITFCEDIRYGYEDHVFNAQCCGAAEKICVMPEVLYEWYQRYGHSTSRDRSHEALENRRYAIIKLKETEDDIAKRFGRTQYEETKRTAEYFHCYLQDLLNSGLSLREQKQYLEALKITLKIKQPEILFPKDIRQYVAARCAISGSLWFYKAINQVYFLAKYRWGIL